MPTRPAKPRRESRLGRLALTYGREKCLVDATGTVVPYVSLCVSAYSVVRSEQKDCTIAVGGLQAPRRWLAGGCILVTEDDEHYHDHDWARQTCSGKLNHRGWDMTRQEAAATWAGRQLGW